MLLDQIYLPKGKRNKQKITPGMIRISSWGDINIIDHSIKNYGPRVDI